jgi:hypothetical protein
LHLAIFLRGRQTRFAARFGHGEELIGRDLFEVFRGDDPVQSATLRNLYGSFERVLATRQADSMAVQKYDIQRPLSEGGGFEERYWSPVNSPVPNDGSAVQFIIHRVEDVTEFVRVKRIETLHGQLTGDLRIRADQAEAELILRSRQLAESQLLLRERQEVEEQLLASEARFGMAFAEAGRNGAERLTDVSSGQTYLDMLGYSREN